MDCCFCRNRLGVHITRGILILFTWKRYRTCIGQYWNVILVFQGKQGHLLLFTIKLAELPFSEVLHFFVRSPYLAHFRIFLRNNQATEIEKRGHRTALNSNR